MKGPHPFIQSTSKGLFIRVHVQPRSSRNEITGVHAGALKVKVTTPPAEGEANKAVIELLSKTLRVPKSTMSVASGRTSRDKLIKVEGVLPDALEAKLGALALDED